MVPLPPPLIYQLLVGFGRIPKTVLGTSGGTRPPSPIALSYLVRFLSNFILSRARKSSFGAIAGIHLRACGTGSTNIILKLEIGNMEQSFVLPIMTLMHPVSSYRFSINRGDVQLRLIDKADKPQLFYCLFSLTSYCLLARAVCTAAVHRRTKLCATKLRIRFAQCKSSYLPVPFLDCCTVHDM